MKKYIFIFLLFFIKLSFCGYSQIVDNRKTIELAIIPQQIKLDTLSVFPFSIYIITSDNDTLARNLYDFDFATSTIIFSDSAQNINKSIIIKYIVFPYNLTAKYRHKDDLLSLTEKTDTMPYYTFQPETKKEPFYSEGLQKQGSITRGISVGNTQNASLQSSLDLQFSGKLTDDVEVQAVITDRNIPIQPEGNTHQLQEFDKVFIQLSHKSSKLIAGDYDLRKPPGYFMNFFKKSQGGYGITSWKDGKSLFGKDTSNHHVEVSGGISKGKFARNIFQGSEGNQGPYRLKGAENELFIIILAGTERIFINGEMLVRGQENDYVIDYNTAEVIFTPKRIINSDSRIVIEFEYADKNYLRSMFFGSYNYSDNTVDFRLNFFSEQDAKNQPLQQTLTDEEKLILQLAGDDINKSVIHGWDSVGFSGDYVLYEMIDTLSYDSVFVHSTNPAQAVYKVRFSYVGQGGGHYVQAQSSANGRVFKWVAPQYGIPQGEYAPVIILVTPKKEQMTTLGADFKLSKNSKAGFEVALSNRDKNTFSAIDNHDNIGSAGKVYISRSTILKHDTLKQNLKLNKMLSYEFQEARFNILDRYRSVEFERDWNIQQNIHTNEHIISGIFSLEQNKRTYANYRSDYFLKSGVFNGFKQNLQSNIKVKNVNSINNTSLMQSNYDSHSTTFLRTRGNLNTNVLILNTGVNYELEHNTFILPDDSLMNNSYAFYDVEPYIAFHDTSKTIYRLYYRHRENFRASNNMLNISTLAQETGVSFQHSFKNANRLFIQSAYRQLHIKDTLLTNLKDENTFVTKIENNLNLWQGALSSLLFYETSSGLEAKRECSYLEVAPGQGQYMWTDYNGNGVKELDEFEIAPYQDVANYIRIFIPTNEYVRVFMLRFSKNIFLEPARLWEEKDNNWKKTISRFSNRFSYTHDSKTTSSDFTERFVPVISNYEDITLIHINSSLRNTIFFNRAHPKFSAQYSFFNNINKILLTNGMETRRLKNNELRLMWNATVKTSIESAFRLGEKSNLSEYFQSRNYLIALNEFEQRFNYQPTTNNRYSLMFRYKTAENTQPYGEQRTEIITMGPEIRFLFRKNQVVFMNIHYHSIKYNDDVNTPIAFEMLEALRPGQNLTWSLNLQYNISRSFQLNIQYQGRKPEDIKAIHYGNMQIRAML